MKKYLTIIILLISSFPLVMKSQDTVSLIKEDIVGRWIETKRIEGDNIKEITEYHDTYIFRDNMIFHKGEASEGVILFNITGKYTVEEDSIIIFYRDYIKKNASSEDAKKLVFKILSLEGDEMLVSVQDYDYEYKMVLKRS